MAERYSHAWSTTALLHFDHISNQDSDNGNNNQYRQPRNTMQPSWSTTALLDFNSTDVNSIPQPQPGNAMQRRQHSPNATTAVMQPSPSLSQLLKRRRRRCGGIFKPTQTTSSPDGLGLEYDWPYHQPVPASIPNLSIDTGRANEAFFRRSRTEFEPQTQMTRAGSAVELSGDGERGGRSGSNESKYDFERDVEGVDGRPATEGEGTLPSDSRNGFVRDCEVGEAGDVVSRNLATRARTSTRSASVYSQESLNLEREMSAFRDRRHNGTKETDVGRPRPRDVEQDSDAEISVSKTRRSISVNTNSHWSSQARINQKQQTVNTTVKLPRTTSTPFGTRFGSIRQVSSKLLTRTASITESVAEKVNNLKIRTLSSQRTRSAREGSGSSAGSSEVANGTEGQHSLGGNVGHGPTHSELARDHATRHVSVSSKRNGRRQRRVY